MGGAAAESAMGSWRQRLALVAGLAARGSHRRVVVGAGGRKEFRMLAGPLYRRGLADILNGLWSPADAEGMAV